MAMMFDEHSRKAQEIMFWVETFLSGMEYIFKIHFKVPHHDIARRFLNHITEFKATED